MLSAHAGHRWRSGALLAIGLIGIGAAPQPPATRPTNYRVSMDGTAFMPPMLHVKVRELVTWVNNDPFPHTIVSREGGFHSTNIQPGQSWRHRFTRTGIFPYVCSLHPTMTGAVVVE